MKSINDNYSEYSVFYIVSERIYTGQYLSTDIQNESRLWLNNADLQELLSEIGKL